MSNTFETIVILDFGSPYTQLFARRIRELGVCCEMHPYNLSQEALKQRLPKGITLSGGPSSVCDTDTPHCLSQVLDLDVPVLSICNVPADFPIWMSHGAHVPVAPSGFDVIAASDNSLGAVGQPAKSLYEIQFHPEVANTSDGSQILSNFVKAFVIVVMIDRLSDSLKMRLNKFANGLTMVKLCVAFPSELIH